MLPHTKGARKSGFSRKLSKAGLVALASLVALGGTGGMAFAARAGGVGGGFHGGVGGGFHGGFAGALHGGGGFHGGAFRGGGFHGAPFHDGLHGRFYGAGAAGWWWGPDWFGLDLYLAALPWYYETYWWDNVPYYYVNGDYYVWNGDAGEYEQVQPPQQIAKQGPGQAPATADNLFVYPKNGQTQQQQASDESQCSSWASGQSGYTPAHANGPATNQDDSSALAKQQDYLRADGACLEGRGYSVE